MQEQSSTMKAGFVPGHRTPLVALTFACAFLGSCLNGDSPASGDAPRRAVAAVSSSTYDYVLAGLTVDLPGLAKRAGFNLDGLYSTTTSSGGCGVADSFSSMTNGLHQNGCDMSDPNCQGGVDNALPEVVEVLDDSMRMSFRTAANTSILNGHAIWLVRVTDVDSATDDEDVRINLYRGFAKGSSCASAFAGGASFYVDNASLATSGDLAQPLWWMRGSIYNGKLYVSSALSLSSSVYAPLSVHQAFSASSSMNFNLYRASMYLDGSALGGSGAVSAMFGGWVYTDSFSYALETTFSSISTQIFNLMPKLSDLPNYYSGACDTGSTLAVGGISMGAMVTLQPAVIVGTASSAGANTCGTSW